MMDRSMEHVLMVCAKWLQENKNGGWTSFHKPPQNAQGHSAIELARELDYYEAACRLEACGLLERKEDTLFRLCPHTLAKLVVTDPSLFPEGELVYMGDVQKNGVLVEYNPKAESFPFLIQYDGERATRAVSIHEVQKPEWK